MVSDWQGKVVIVTGGSRGLGRAIAAEYGAAGAKVVIASRNADDLARCAGQLRSEGADVLTVPTDVVDDQQVQNLITQTLDRYGRIDVLVNNAGRSDRSEIADVTPATFERFIDVNFLSAVRCTRAALTSLLETGGSVINIASLAGKTGAPLMGAYPASKFALVAYSQQLRLELGPRGLHVLLVCPGPIRRTDAGMRYQRQAAGLPGAAQLPAAGAKLSAIEPDWLAKKILKACRRRRPELVVPGRARYMFALAQLWPRLGDWVLKKMTG